MSTIAFKLKDGVASLNEKDLERWRYVFSDLDVFEVLTRISQESQNRPWMFKKNWFHQLSAYLHKLEKGECKMAYEQRDNSGSLFKNEKKQQDNHPDYTGSAIVDGVHKKLAAWVKTAKSGKKYFSISIKDDEEKPKPINSAEQDGYNGPPDNLPQGSPEFEDIPF